MTQRTTTTLIGLLVACAAGSCTKVPVPVTSSSTIGHEPLIGAEKARRSRETPSPAARPPPHAMAAYFGQQHFRTRGVDAGDTLKVRAAPEASALQLAALKPDQQTVLWTGMSSSNGRSTWWRIATAGIEGWVNRRFLEPAAGDSGPGPLPTLLCLGNEPFWALRVAPDGATSCEETCPGIPGLRSALTSQANDRWSLAVVKRDGTHFLSGELAARTCSDGMSDFRYSLSVKLDADAVHLEGCCRLELTAGSLSAGEAKRP